MPASGNGRTRVGRATGHIHLNGRCWDSCPPRPGGIQIRHDDRARGVGRLNRGARPVGYVVAVIPDWRADDATGTGEQIIPGVLLAGGSDDPIRTGR